MILIPHIAGKNYVVMGLGISGTAAAYSLQASGAKVWAWDDNPEHRQKAQSQGIHVQEVLPNDWLLMEALVLNPSIPHRFPFTHPYALKAQEVNIPIICDINFLAQAQPQSCFIGITGTNGKSTTTALIGHLLKTAGLACQIGGNIGISALDLVPFEGKGYFILELSSYQLELTPDLQLDRAVLLNITPDHLTRHGGMEGYIVAKCHIFQHCAHRPNPQLIIGIDDTPCETIYEDLKQKHCVRSISITKLADIYVDEGILFDEGEYVFNIVQESKLLGRHNMQNIAAAYAIGKSLGLTKEILIQGLATFEGLVHRMESLGTIENVEFVNDSKATNSEAVAKALACYDNIYWILGGQAKESGLIGLEAFYSRIRHAFLIGESIPEFQKVLKGKMPVTVCYTLDKAVEAAFEAACRGTLEIDQKQNKPVVLLSPACASWDQFKNFEHRGEVFREMFFNLKAYSLHSQKDSA